jgi:phage tail sheath protein FI
VDARRGLISENGAMYYPWIRVEEAHGVHGGCIPPCGHVAGIYARTDANVGVFKAPANELLDGVVDLAVPLTEEDQGPLNDLGINCLRSLGGRGIRVWGARTLSGLSDWTYVNVRRLFITLGRWIRQYQVHVCFEPHTEELWARIERDVTVYLSELFQRGAFKGDMPDQAFYVRCDAETNISYSRDQGCLVTEIGLCPRVPGEFIVVRLFQKPDGVHIVGIPEPDRT